MRKPQLFLFHFAGGNCYSFRFLTPLLPGYEVIAPELPGRGRRINEPLLNDFDEAAKDLYDQVMAHLTTPEFLIYGHSMGAYLTLRVAGMLEKAGRYPAGIIVSGNAGPGIQAENKKIRYLLNRADFIEELRTLGGVPPEVIDNEELFNVFEPVLRADFRIVELNDLTNEPPVQTPIYALMGDEEEMVTEINNWARFTTGYFQSAILEGNHFFIYRHPNRIAGIINAFCHRLPA
jgi:external thioesterase TEII